MKPAKKPPAAPTNLKAGVSMSIALAWSLSSGATKYSVYRSTDGTRGTAIGSLLAPPFVDTTAVAGTNYTYGVTASNAAGESALSAQVQAMLPLPAPSPTPSAAPSPSPSPTPPPSPTPSPAPSPSPSPSPSPTPSPSPSPTGTLDILRIPDDVASFTTSLGTWTISGGFARLNGSTALPEFPDGSGALRLTRINGEDIVLQSNDTIFQQPIRKISYANPEQNRLYWHQLDDDTNTHDPIVDILNAPAGYINPQTAPASLWELELTSKAVIAAAAGYNIDTSVSYGQYAFGDAPGNLPEFGVDALGIQYMRFTNNPNALGYFPLNTDFGCAFVNWFLPLSPGNPGAVQVPELHVRYLLWIESDVPPSHQDLGMKLPGPTMEGSPAASPGTLVNYRLFYQPPLGGTMRLSDYFYDSTDTPTSADYPKQHYTGGVLKCNQWNVLEVGGRMNTFTGGTPNADGWSTITLNGRMVYHRQNYVLTTSDLTFWRAFQIAMYEGGDAAPLTVAHWRLAKLAASEAPIGVPVELMPAPSPALAWPAWRTAPALATLGQFAAIPNTNMSALAVDSLTVDGFQGMAATPTSLLAVACGGHVGWQNGVIELDVTQPRPAWAIRFAGSPFSAVQSDAIRTGPPALYPYADGLPCGSQTYSWTQYIAALKRVMRLYLIAPHDLTPPIPINNVDGFRLDTNAYDPQGTWAVGPISQFAAEGYHSSVAKHPTTNIVYIGTQAGNFYRWDYAAASATVHGFTQFSVPGNPIYGYRASFIDAARNRWVRYGGALEYIDLSNPAAPTYNTIAYTGAVTAMLNDLNGTDSNEASGACHDPDRDLYIALANNGNVYSIHPTTGLVTFIQTLPDIPHKEAAATSNGWNNRVAYFAALGAIVCVPSFAANAYCMPTRVAP